MGITHATGVNVCVDGHINHLGATNALWVQEHGIKPQCDHRHACVFINANQKKLTARFRLFPVGNEKHSAAQDNDCYYVRHILLTSWTKGMRGGNFCKAEIE